MSAPSDPGPIGEEALRLLEAVQGWARATFGDGPAAHVGNGSATCEWCPLCQLVAVLRGDRPETTEKLVAAGAAMMNVLRSVVDAQSAPEPAENAPHVQRIDLDD